jgi:excisionase family DNA binding protein
MQELPPLAPQHLTPMAFTVDEAVVVSRIGRNSLYLAVETGALRARKLGRKTLILKDDLRAWLESLPSASSGGANEAEKLPGKNRAPAEPAAAPSPKRRLVAAE